MEQKQNILRVERLQQPLDQRRPSRLTVDRQLVDEPPVCRALPPPALPVVERAMREQVADVP